MLSLDMGGVPVGEAEFGRDLGWSLDSLATTSEFPSMRVASGSGSGAKSE